MSSDSNVMGMVLVVLLLANLGVSIYVAAKVRRAEEEEDYARPKLTTPSPQTTRPTTSAPGIGRAGNIIP